MVFSLGDLFVGVMPCPPSSAVNNSSTAAAAADAALGDCLPADGFGLVQVLFLGFCYGYILFWASNLISDGSELLLCIESLRGIVGTVVLPILGAVPDGAIVLFSGMGPNAQQQLSVGVGALAGSTVMLLTIPWFLAVLAGRVDLDGTGSPRYRIGSRRNGVGGGGRRLTKQGLWPALLGTGVGVGPKLALNAKMMFLTSLGYLIIQVPAFVLESDGDNARGIEAGEHTYALVGLIVCFGAFGLYLFYEVKFANTTHLVDNATRKAINQNLLSLSGAFADVDALNALSRHASVSSVNLPEVFRSSISGGSGSNSVASTLARRTGLGLPPKRADTFSDENTEALLRDPADARLRTFLRTYFRLYDRDKSGSIDAHEFKSLLKDLNVRVSPAGANALLAEADTDHNGKLNYNEFVAVILYYIHDAKNNPYNAALSAPSVSKLLSVNMPGSMGAIGSAASASEIDTAAAKPLLTMVGGEEDLSEPEEEEEEEEEPELPEDIAEQPVEKQKRALLMRSLWMMGVGTVFVLLFSDPMVDVLDSLGQRAGVPPFYVAFILAPLASNASELIAAYKYALKKTRYSINISLSTLEGAAIMNNTFCLGIFLVVVYARNLEWKFSAETLSILIVELIMAAIAHKRTHRLIDGCIVLLLFPISLILVWLLENVAGMD